MSAEARGPRRPVEREYARIVERHRDELHAHSRRILRSAHDAEDALQEALLRAWRALPSFEGRGSLRSWIYRIVTNTSLDVAQSRPTLVVPIDQEHPAVSPEPDPEDRLERREALERALVTAQRVLPERQREVLIMREALGFSAEETADRLGTTVAAVNSALRAPAPGSTASCLRHEPRESRRRLVALRLGAVAACQRRAALGLHLSAASSGPRPPLPGRPGFDSAPSERKLVALSAQRRNLTVALCAMCE